MKSWDRVYLIFPRIFISPQFKRGNSLPKGYREKAQFCKNILSRKNIYILSREYFRSTENDITLKVLKCKRLKRDILRKTCRARNTPLSLTKFELTCPNVMHGCLTAHHICYEPSFQSVSFLYVVRTFCMRSGVFLQEKRVDQVPQSSTREF